MAHDDLLYDLLKWMAILNKELQESTNQLITDSSCCMSADCKGLEIHKQ